MEASKLIELAEPFPESDVEWRVNRVPKKGIASGGVWVLPYVKARALHTRLDEVCGPANWKTLEPKVIEAGPKGVLVVGLAIFISDHDDWVTRWDVSQPTGSGNIDPMKAGYTYAFKRAAAQFGLGRHLRYIDEQWAKVREEKPKREERGWNYAMLSKEKGGDIYYWQTPSLPGAALPKTNEEKVSREEVQQLFGLIRETLCPDCQDPKEREESITRFIHSVAGEFHVSDHTCWTRDAMDKCTKRIKESNPGKTGISPDVSFDE